MRFGQAVSRGIEWMQVYRASLEIESMQVFRVSRGIEWMQVYRASLEIESTPACLGNLETGSTPVFPASRGIESMQVDRGGRVITYKIFPAELPTEASGKIGVRRI